MSFLNIIDDTAANWTAKNPVLDNTVIGREFQLSNFVQIGSLRCKIGDGVTHWNDLPSFAFNVTGSLPDNVLYSGTLLTDILAAETISNGDAVFVDSSGLWERATATEFIAQGIFVGTTPVTVGQVATVLAQGTVRRSAWSWTPGNVIYLSATAGGLTQTAPSASAELVQKVGFAITSTIAYFNFDPSVSIVGASELNSGTYTPTLTNTTNLAASTAFACQYMRVGNTVTVSGKVAVDPTSTGACLLGISLPIASNIAAAENLGGVAFATGIAGQGAGIEGDLTNDRASMKWVAVDVTNQVMAFTFTYHVI